MSTTTTSPGGRKRRPTTRSGPNLNANLNTHLTEQFRELRLPMFREHFESQAERAVAEPLNHTEYLSELTDWNVRLGGKAGSRV